MLKSRWLCVKHRRKVYIHADLAVDVWRRRMGAKRECFIWIFQYREWEKPKLEKRNAIGKRSKISYRSSWLLCYAVCPFGCNNVSLTLFEENYSFQWCCTLVFLNLHPSFHFIATLCFHILQLALYERTTTMNVSKQRVFFHNHKISGENVEVQNRRNRIR